MPWLADKDFLSSPPSIGSLKSGAKSPSETPDAALVIRMLSERINDSSNALIDDLS